VSLQSELAAARAQTSDQKAAAEHQAEQLNQLQRDLSTVREANSKLAKEISLQTEQYAGNLI